MRRALLVAVAVATLAPAGRALDVPYLSGRVTDDAHLLDAATTARLDAALKGYEDRTGRQFAVLTIPSLRGEPLEQFSLKVARTWALDRKGKNDGVLLLIARDDHKVRIEVGYGLEGDLPDALAGRIIRDAIVPRFRGGDFPGGVTAGVEEVLAALGGSVGAGRSFARRRHFLTSLKEWGSLIFVAAAMIWFFLSVTYQLFFQGAYMALPEFFMCDFLLAFGVGRLLDIGRVAPFIALPVGFLAARLWAPYTDWGRRLLDKKKRKGTSAYWIASAFGSSGGSSSGGGFSGGGGGFGGGGASGSW